MRRKAIIMKDKLLTKLSKLLHKIGVEDTKIEEIVNDLKDDKEEAVKEDEVKTEPEAEPIKQVAEEGGDENKPVLTEPEKPIEEPIKDETIEEPTKGDLEKEQEEITEEKKNDIVDTHQGEEIVALKEDVNGVKTKMEEYGEKLTALYNALKEAGIIEKEKKDAGLPGKANGMVEEETTADLLKRMNSRF